MENRKVLRKVFYAFKMILEAPLCISGSSSDATDKDVIRNGAREAFIPGSSVAGALREAMASDAEKFMGFSRGKEGAMSHLIISDMFFADTPVISVRDGVQLSSDKSVENKFDMEIVETGAKTVLYLQYIERENDNYDYEQAIRDLVASLCDGSIRFGSNKNRGFGRLNLSDGKVYRREISAANIAASYDFLTNVKELDMYECEEYADWSKNVNIGDKYASIRVPLRLTGGISIRRYSTKPNQPDFEHITCNDKPVIPGSSWNGAIRSACRDILKNLDCPHTGEFMDMWFGTTEKQSMIVISESIIENAKSMPMTRNRINRFDNSTKDGALYTEKTCLGGTTVLEIKVRKDASYEALLGLLDLVVKDIANGYVPVGGMVAVGRGIFELNGEITYKGAEQVKCSSALANLW